MDGGLSSLGGTMNPGVFVSRIAPEMCQKLPRCPSTFLQVKKPTLCFFGIPMVNDKYNFRSVSFIYTSSRKKLHQNFLTTLCFFKNSKAYTSTLARQTHFINRLSRLTGSCCTLFIYECHLDSREGHFIDKRE